MTSTLSTGTTKTEKPPVCKKGMVPATPPIVAGLPTSLNAYATLKQTDSGGPVHLHEVLKLARRDTNDGWTARTFYESADLQIDVDDPDENLQAKLTLRLLRDGAPTDEHQWTYNLTPGQTRWTTPTYIANDYPPDQLWELRILG